jgi:hypothetical protein
MTESPVLGWQDYVPQVREYLAFCDRSRADLAAMGRTLDQAYHPTANGAVKLIAHRGDAAEADKIRQAFAELTGNGQPSPRGRALRPGTKKGNDHETTQALRRSPDESGRSEHR